MFEQLIPGLGDAFWVIAPDHLGFGHSDAPPAYRFAYTFDRLAAIAEHWTQAVGLRRYTLFVQDYGGPIGMRLAVAHPDRLQALIVQNAVSHEAGLGPLWDQRRAFWRDRAANEAALRENLLSLAATKQRHIGSTPHPERYSPDLWVDEYRFLTQPGMIDIQSDLFYDYRTNVASYPAWQEFLRATQPPLLVVWGRYDPSFQTAGALAYRDDVPGAQVHLLDAGHFALDEAADEITALTRTFLAQVNAAR